MNLQSGERALNSFKKQRLFRSAQDSRINRPLGTTYWNRNDDGV
jgi:hypothetical protein